MSKTIFTPPSDEVSRILEKRHREASSGIYLDLTQHEKRHLDECSRRGCVTCREARLLIRHYKKMARETARQ